MKVVETDEVCLVSSLVKQQKLIYWPTWEPLLYPRLSLLPKFYLYAELHWLACFQTWTPCWGAGETQRDTPPHWSECWGPWRGGLDPPSCSSKLLCVAAPRWPMPAPITIEERHTKPGPVRYGRHTHTHRKNRQDNGEHAQFTLNLRARNLFLISRKFPLLISPLKGSLRMANLTSFCTSCQRA